MKSLFKSLFRILPFLSVVFVCGYAFAQDGSVMEPQDFFVQIIQAVQKIGGLSTLGIISLVITLLVSSLKVSFMNDLLWSKLGDLKFWVAPLLAAVGGFLQQIATTGGFTWAALFVFLTAGTGAVFVHEILDLIKKIPGIGPMYIMIINLIQATLGGPKPQALKK